MWFPHRRTWECDECGAIHHSRILWRKPKPYPTTPLEFPLVSWAWIEFTDKLIQDILRDETQT